VRSKLALTLLVVAAACGPVETTVTEGETLVVVDTDLPVPRIASRLRIDLYTDAGEWYASRDVSIARPTDWPTSFGLGAKEAETVGLVRLRAYPEGGVRDYRGERFEPRPPAGTGADALLPAPVPPPTDKPRLLDETGKDVTPSSEPEPLLTVDRLIRVRAVPGVKKAVRVDLRGVCAGTMSDVTGRASCVDQENVRVPVVELPFVDEATRSAPSRAGTFDPSTPCPGAPRAASTAADGTPLFDEQVCVPGALFVFGSRDGVFGEAEDLPQRLAVVDGMLVDRYEVTVGRYRRALAAGFQSPDATPTANDGAIPVDPTPYLDPKMCTWSTTPIGRETFPLSCISPAAAAAFCAFEGGELPSEAEWEYVALVAGRATRTRFPWGGDDDVAPSCDRATWGRGEVAFAGQKCAEKGDGFGPLTVDAHGGASGDRTPGLGLVGMAGSMLELTRDTFAPMTSTCWMASSLRDPGCRADASLARTVRGSCWRDNIAGLAGATRRKDIGAESSLGFRCIRRSGR